jgi:hypothetical protein
VSQPRRHRLFVTVILLAFGFIVIAGGVVLALSEGKSLGAAIIGSLLALTAFVLLLRTDTELLIRVLRGLQLLLPIVAFAVTTLMMGKTAGTIRFDEVAAQVIIVLLLVLAVDARFFRLKKDRDRLDVVAIVYTMVLLGSGEFYALRGLLTSDPARAETIAGAVAAGFVAVAVIAMTGAESEGSGIGSGS